MSRPIVLGVAALMLFALGVIAANTRIAQGVIPVTSYEADVNKDAHINVADLGLVASKYGQIVPTPTRETLQPHETTLWIGGIVSSAAGYAPEYQLVSIDTANYPAGTTFRLGWTVYNGGSGPRCIRLVMGDTDNPDPVVGSEVCSETDVLHRYYESGPLPMLPGRHMYKALSGPVGASLPPVVQSSVVLVARWLE